MNIMTLEERKELGNRLNKQEKRKGYHKRSSPISSA